MVEWARGPRCACGPGTALRRRARAAQQPGLAGSCCVVKGRAARASRAPQGLRGGAHVCCQDAAAAGGRAVMGAPVAPRWLHVRRAGGWSTEGGAGQRRVSGAWRAVRPPSSSTVPRRGGAGTLRGPPRLVLLAGHPVPARQCAGQQAAGGARRGEHVQAVIAHCAGQGVGGVRKASAANWWGREGLGTAGMAVREHASPRHSCCHQQHCC